MNKQKIILYLLHIANDGYRTSLLLLLPFVAQSFQINLTQVGLLGTTMNALEAALAIPAGMIALRIGGMKTLFIALISYSIGYVLMSLAPHVFIVFVAFIFAGVGFSLFHPVAFAIVARMATKQNRGSLMGSFTAIGDIGRIGLSSLITFLVSLIGWKNASFSFFLSTIVLVVLTAFTIFQKREKETINMSRKELSYLSLLRNNQFLLATSSYMLDSFTSSTLFIFLPFLFLARNIEPVLLGVVTSTYFVGNIFGKVILGKLSDVVGEKKVFIVSEVVMSGLLILLTQTTYIPFLLFISVILGVVTKGTVPVLTSMLSRTVEKTESYEQAYGLNSMFVGISSGIAPVCIGYIADRLGIFSAFTILAAFGILAIIPSFFLQTAKRP